MWRKLSFTECSFSAIGAVTTSVPMQQGKLPRRLCLVINPKFILDESHYLTDGIVMVSYRLAYVMNGVSRRW